MNRRQREQAEALIGYWDDAYTAWRPETLVDLGEEMVDLLRELMRDP